MFHLLPTGIASIAQGYRENIFPWLTRAAVTNDARISVAYNKHLFLVVIISSKRAESLLIDLVHSRAWAAGTSSILVLEPRRKCGGATRGS